MEEAAGAPLLQPRGEVAAAAAGKRWPGARRAAAEWWVESKKLWRIVGPAIFQRIALYAINVVSQAFNRPHRRPRARRLLHRRHRRRRLQLRLLACF
ncbi:hypothetical protein ACP70R_014887 [Stipagrostis hirtigluma subsp. patula]